MSDQGGGGPSENSDQGRWLALRIFPLHLEFPSVRGLRRDRNARLRSAPAAGENIERHSSNPPGSQAGADRRYRSVPGESPVAGERIWERKPERIRSPQADPEKAEAQKLFALVLSDRA